MAPLLHVGTRKGLIVVEQSGGRWRIAQTHFLAEPVTMTLGDPRDGTWYAGLRLGHFGPKLRRSRDRGKTWAECATPAFPVVKDESDKAASVDTIWSLEIGGPKERGTLWAGTVPGGLFRSRDGGDSWELVTSLWERPERREWFGGGYDAPGIHSICVDPRDARRVLLGVSCGGVWGTDDDGANWSSRAQGMRAAYMPPEQANNPNVQDPHRMVRCAARPDVLWVQHHNGIFRSTDDAKTWTEITGATPSGFGFAVAVHPQDAATAWFVPAVKDECRVPVNNEFVVTRTRDGGRGFESLRSGLPQEMSFDLVYRHGLDIDASGERLAVGSTTGALWVSDNQGDAWQLVSAHLPPIYSVRFA
ncbi:MAG TPA: exo-alpha-sialidase [Burkholderiales bacterium]|nr:exo-alpha-sialidase [Burkholderiales bacterium]